MNFDPSGHFSFKKTWNNYWDNWQDGIDILKDSGTAGRLFARHSEGVVDTLGSQVDAIRHPLRTAKANIADYVSAGKSDWYNWNPGCYIGSKIGHGIANFGKDVYHGDWDSVAYKAGGASVGIAEAGVASWASKAVSGVRALCQGKTSPEVYYRSMSQGDYDYLRMTGELPATGETFISPTKSYSSNYNGTTVKFSLNSGTTSQLESIGLRNGARIVSKQYPNMPKASGVKWTSDFAYFKGEGSQINIGLGKGKALETFNSNILNYTRVN